MNTVKKSLLEPEMLVDKKFWARKSRYSSQKRLIEAYVKQQVKNVVEKEANIQENISLIAQEIKNLLQNPTLIDKLEDHRYQEIILGMLQESIATSLIMPDMNNSILERFHSDDVILSFIKKQELAGSLAFSKSLISLIEPSKQDSLNQLEEKWKKVKDAKCSDFSDFI